MRVNTESQKPQAFTLALVAAVMTLAAIGGYGYQMAPSPVLNELMQRFGLIGGVSLANLSISIVWPPVIIASLSTGPLIARLGIWRVNTLALILMTAGCAGALLPGGYMIFLAARVIWGLGFGFFVSFMGAAIVKWYAPRQRALMNTLNGLFPFLGLAVCFNLEVPLLKAVNQNLVLSFALWGILTAAGLVLWLLAVRGDAMGYAATPEGKAEEKAEAAAQAKSGAETGLYKNLLRRKEIVCLCLIFVADFFCVQYVATVMPDFLIGSAGLSGGTASLLVGLFFPVVGIAGAIIGGIKMERSGLRRPILIASTMFKFLGIVVIVAGSFVGLLPIMIVGLTLFSIGNSIWMPVLYNVITELDDMNPARSAGAFALVTSMGFIAGFLSPIVGGALSDVLGRLSGQSANAARMFGYTWSMAAFSFICFVGLIAAFKIRETGPGRTQAADSRKLSKTASWGF